MMWALVFILLAGISNAYTQYQASEEIAWIGWAQGVNSGRYHSENLMFEAKPYVKFPIIDEFYDRVKNLDQDSSLIFRGFLVFDPHLRMYTSNSNPIKMPSYKIFPSLSVSHALGQSKNPLGIATFVLDHGHYSNGQQGCTFGSSADGDSICAEKYQSLDLKKDNLSDEINRNTGEFSTNLFRTKIKFYQIQKINPEYRTVEIANEFSLSYTRLTRFLFGKKIAGYNRKDAAFYPLNQIHFEYAFHKYLENHQYRVGIGIAWLPTDNSAMAHYNISLFGNYTLENGFGFFLKGETGQDSYNLRMVDKVARVAMGFSWNVLSSEPLKVELPQE